MALVASGLTLGVLPRAEASGAPTTPAATPKVTRAALDPALVAGRGAAVPFVEQEAENAVTNGTSSARTGRPTRCPPRRPAARRSA